MIFCACVSAGKPDAAKILGAEAAACKPVRDAVKPLVQWLEEEEDSDDE